MFSTLLFLTTLTTVAPAGDAALMSSNLWDDGNAEVCVYDAREVVEGRPRQFVAFSVVVAETFAPEDLVKRDDWRDGGVAVLKNNWFMAIPTGMYQHQRMSSLFFRRQDGALVKATFSSQDWCGNVFQLWRADQPGLTVHSYWEGEADRTWPLAENAVFSDQLPLWLRGQDLLRARTDTRPLVRTRLTGRAPRPVVEQAELRFEGRVEDGAGAAVARVTVQTDSGQQVLTFAAEEPHVLQSWQRSDGTRYTLRRVQRLPYWQYSADEFQGMLLDQPDNP